MKTVLIILGVSFTLISTLIALAALRISGLESEREREREWEEIKRKKEKEKTEDRE